MEDDYCLFCGKKISNEQGKIKELNDNFKPKISKRIVEIVFVIFINIFYCLYMRVFNKINSKGGTDYIIYDDIYYFYSVNL